jgi:hypothetical protein
MSFDKNLLKSTLTSIQEVKPPQKTIDLRIKIELEEGQPITDMNMIMNQEKTQNERIVQKEKSQPEHLLYIPITSFFEDANIVNAASQKEGGIERSNFTLTMQKNEKTVTLLNFFSKENVLHNIAVAKFISTSGGLVIEEKKTYYACKICSVRDNMILMEIEINYMGRDGEYTKYDGEKKMGTLILN